MKYIGVDFGDARVGIASTDLGGCIASAVGIIKVKGLNDAVEKVTAKAKELGGQAFVVGLPKTAFGTEEYRVERTKRFAIQLEEASGLPVHFCDERFSTGEALRYLSEGGVYGSKRKQVLDAVAAQIILQSYVDGLSRKG
ncbi:MAG: Holliday junction resolvase RuvX [Ruminococcaceae bacterium]|nr:Holliday junction resolvase RuvX [Oscillospiraceae bacterium]